MGSLKCQAGRARRRVLRLQTSHFRPHTLRPCETKPTLGARGPGIADCGMAGRVGGQVDSPLPTRSRTRRSSAFICGSKGVRLCETKPTLGQGPWNCGLRIEGWDKASVNYAKQSQRHRSLKESAGGADCAKQSQPWGPGALELRIAERQARSGVRLMCFFLPSVGLGVHPWFQGNPIVRNKANAGQCHVRSFECQAGQGGRRVLPTSNFTLQTLHSATVRSKANARNEAMVGMAHPTGADACETKPTPGEWIDVSRLSRSGYARLPSCAKQSQRGGRVRTGQASLGCGCTAWRGAS